MKRILILDQDQLFMRQIADFCHKSAFVFECVNKLERAQQLLASKDFDLLLCERQLGVQDLLPWLKELRQRSANLRIIVLSRWRMAEQRVAVLRVCDDFLAKPVSLPELLLRINKLFDRSRQPLSVAEPLSALPIAAGVHLRPQEFKILSCLWQHRNMIVSYELILSSVWGLQEPLPKRRSVSVYIRRIRMKLKYSPLRIKTLSGRGFCLSVIT